MCSKHQNRANERSIPPPLEIETKSNIDEQNKENIPLLLPILHPNSKVVVAGKPTFKSLETVPALELMHEEHFEKDAECNVKQQHS